MKELEDGPAPCPSKVAQGPAMVKVSAVYAAGLSHLDCGSGLSPHENAPSPLEGEGGAHREAMGG